MCVYVCICKSAYVLSVYICMTKLKTTTIYICCAFSFVVHSFRFLFVLFRAPCCQLDNTNQKSAECKLQLIHWKLSYVGENAIAIKSERDVLIEELLLQAQAQPQDDELNRAAFLHI